MATEKTPTPNVRHPAGRPEGAGVASGSLTLAVLLVCHLAACFVLVPPRELLRSEPVLSADYPVHAHRVHVYRRALYESGLPWGYDPAVSAGTVMAPYQDAGAKPQEFLGALMPFTSAGTVVRVFTFISALTFPLWTYFAARRLGFPPSAVVWVLLALMIPAWLYDNFVGFYRWGLAAFVTTAYACPLVLSLFLEFLARPCRRTYLVALAGLSGLTLFHVLGPVVIGFPMLLYSLCARSLSWKWRFAALAAPLGVALVNSFWLAPLVWSRLFPNVPPGYQTVSGSLPFSDLTYGGLQDLLHALSLVRVLALLGGLALTAYGLARMRRQYGTRVAGVFALAILCGVVLKFGGSFVLGTVNMQPLRFILPTLALAALPVGLGLADVVCRLRLPQTCCALAVVGVSVVAAAGLGNQAKSLPSFNLPKGIRFPAVLDPVEEFVANRTSAEDRLLVQTRIQSEPKILALAWNREVVGNTYPDLRDPAQFLSDRLLGRKLEDWSADELRAALERWGIDWVIAHNENANRLLAAALDSPGERIGTYRVFRVPGPQGRFLMGRGRLEAKVNRIELKELEAQRGLVVLRYRFHPAWTTDPQLTIRSYPVPEDPVGFLAIENPPPTVVLRFSPWKALSAPWPNKRSAPDSPGTPRPGAAAAADQRKHSR